jgi:probable addiction module antidote protein
MEGNDPKHIARALGDVARSQGISEIARKAGVGRQALYDALSEKGNPTPETLTSVLSALGLQLSTAARRVNEPHYHINLFWSAEDWIADVRDLRPCSAYGDTRTRGGGEQRGRHWRLAPGGARAGLSGPEPRYRPAPYAAG